MTDEINKRDCPYLNKNLEILRTKIFPDFNAGNYRGKSFRQIIINSVCKCEVNWITGKLDRFG